MSYPCKVVWKRGKPYIRIDFRPSKRIRRAKERCYKRMREIHEHFGKEKAKSLNRTRIEWTDFTWNPVTGCKHGCWYCYARKLTVRFPKIFPNGFEPTFYPERLKEPWDLKKPSKIFVCSIADLFAPWTPREWTKKVMESIEQCPVGHTFILLTKNPEGISPDYKFHDNVWVGVTVETQADTWRIDALRKVQAKVRFVSFEPLLSAIAPNLHDIQWVIVGKLTGSRKVKLQSAWLQNIVSATKALGIPLFMKNNLGLDYKVQEFPELPSTMPVNEREAKTT